MFNSASYKEVTRDCCLKEPSHTSYERFLANTASYLLATSVSQLNQDAICYLPGTHS